MTNDPTDNYGIYRLTIDIAIPRDSLERVFRSGTPIDPTLYITVEDEATALGMTSEKLVVTPANGESSG